MLLHVQNASQHIRLNVCSTCLWLLVQGITSILYSYHSIRHGYISLRLTGPPGTFNPTITDFERNFILEITCKRRTCLHPSPNGNGHHRLSDVEAKVTPTIPYYSLLFPTIPYYSLLFFTIPLLIPTIPYYSLLFPYESLLFPTIHYYSLLFPTSPYYSLLFPTIPYYSLLFPTNPY